MWVAARSAPRRLFWTGSLAPDRQSTRANPSLPEGLQPPLQRPLRPLGDEEFFTTAAHGFHHVDDVAERRVAPMRGDFLSPEMAARFGPEKPIVHFTDEHAEAMMPRDYQYGYRAGQKAKFCL